MSVLGWSRRALRNVYGVGARPEDYLHLQSACASTLRRRRSYDGHLLLNQHAIFYGHLLLNQHTIFQIYHFQLCLITHYVIVKASSYILGPNRSTTVIQYLLIDCFSLSLSKLSDINKKVGSVLVRRNPYNNWKILGNVC